MSRISIPTVEQSLEATKPLLAAVQKQLGVVPNLMKLVGHSPAALEGYLSLNGALAKGKLDARLRERIALAVAEYNGCDYCLSAHDYLGRNVAKLSGSEIDAARDFHSEDPRADAALRFARRVTELRGRVSDADLSTLRDAGFDEASTLEIVVTVALNVLTNYVNNVAQTDIDFPKVAARHAA
ncbi:carboxymuconolactone decarboxylase family protein [soil metagenome]